MAYGTNALVQRACCGVPQGFILGSLLFILHINDIVNTTSLLELIIFADDTTLLFL